MEQGPSQSYTPSVSTIRCANDSCGRSNPHHFRKPGLMLATVRLDDGTLEGDGAWVIETKCHRCKSITIAKFCAAGKVEVYLKAKIEEITVAATRGGGLS